MPHLLNPNSNKHKEKKYNSKWIEMKKENRYMFVYSTIILTEI